MTQMLDLRLNPAADPSRWAKAYARDKLVQIPDIFEPEVADEIETVLRGSLTWRLVFPEPDKDAPGGERVVQLTQAEVAQMGRDVMAQRLRGVMERARDNIGYLYNSYPMIEAYTGGWDAGHPIHLITEFLNSPDFLDFGRAVIGVDQITKADAQATYYARGNFLTRHVDEGHDNERRAAYTLGFTRRWEPDWGGLLMLLDGNKDIERAFLPRFNLLSIFDGRRIHAVSTVSPFAGDGRFQITGWLRDDPAPGSPA